MNPLLQQAIAAHQGGRAAEAERLYAQALRMEPGNPEAQHYFGLLRYQQGRASEALALMGAALVGQPRAPDLLSHHGLALQAAGRLDEALAQLDRALTLDPRYGEAHNNRGGVLCQMGRTQEGIAAFDTALALNPKAVDAHCNRALALCNLGRLAEALTGYERALAVQPNNPELVALRCGVLGELGRAAEALAGYDKVLATAPLRPDWLHHRGLVLLKLGRVEEAVASLERAVAMEPNYAAAWSDRSAMLQQLGRNEDALASVDRALALAPNFFPALHGRGLVLRNLGRHLEALDSFDRSVAAQPNYTESWNDRGVCLHWDFRRAEDALASFDRALALNPRHIGVLTNRGAVLRELGRVEEAQACLDRALAIDPDFITALYNRGSMVWSRRRLYEAALVDLGKVLKQDPDYAFVRGDVLHLKSYAGDWAGFDQAKALIDQGVRAGRSVVAPFVYQALSASPADLQACARIYTAARHPPRPAIFTKTERRPGKIRLGYVCGEFHEHATAHLAAGLFEAHDRTRFEVIAFDNGRDPIDPMRARLIAAFDRMIDIADMGDPDTAQRVAAEDIDILVNLNGYYGLGRMDIFQRRPAPVQVNYLGFPGTLGAAGMDYILADRVVIPPAEQGFYDEQVVYLPGSYQANDARRGVPETSRRADHGLPDDAFVFCYFNHAYKLTPGMFAVWMRILMATPGSVLWLLGGSGPFAGNLRREAEAQGVTADRLIFAPTLGHDEHMARLPLGDLFLDSLPYNAHTTASDALWMGLPLVTCRGTSFPGRVAASLLGAVGLPELIAEDIPAYEALAVALARDPKRLGKVRERLVRGRSTAPLFDTEHFTRHIEAAYTTMLDRWAAGQAPRGFGVDA